MPADAHDLEQPCATCARTSGDHTLREWVTCLGQTTTDLPFEEVPDDLAAAAAENLRRSFGIDGDVIVADHVVVRAITLDGATGPVRLRLPGLLHEYQVGVAGQPPTVVAKVLFAGDVHSIRGYGRLVRDAVMRDARGYRRAPVTMPEYNRGRTPRNKGRRYPPTPPSTEEVVAMLEGCRTERPAELRLRGLVIVLWRSGLRISEALALTEHDLDQRNGSIVVRCGKGGKRRIVGMDEWGWQHLQPWLEARPRFPVGELFCVVDGPTAGRAISGTSARHDVRDLAARVGIRHHVAPHQLRHAMAVDSVREGLSLIHLSRQLGHSNFGVTDTYVQGIAPEEVVHAYGGRAAPKVTALELGGAR